MKLLLTYLKSFVIVILLIFLFSILWMTNKYGFERGLEIFLTPNLQISWERELIDDETSNNSTNRTGNNTVVEDYFTISVKNNWEKIYVWDSNAFEITAKDPNYSDTLLIFSESDRDAELSKDLDNGAIEYNADEKWTMYFDDWAIFSRSGLHDIHVYSLEDSTDSMMWKTEIMVYDRQEELANSKKSDNYWEVCEKDSDCFCNYDKSGLEWCYYKSGQIDICKDNLCTRWFKDN